MTKGLRFLAADFEWAIYQLEAEKDKAELTSVVIPSSTTDRYEAATCTKDVFIPMRDGIHRCTDIYRPAGEQNYTASYLKN
jgi:predicted acyl esterase